jgi:putative DNA primase/helicase
MTTIKTSGGTFRIPVVMDDDPAIAKRPDNLHLVANDGESIEPPPVAALAADKVVQPWQARNVTEAVKMCAKMAPLDYESVRKVVANAFDIDRVSALDAAVEHERDKGDNKQDDPFDWHVKPAPNAVDGAYMLNETVKILERYIAFKSRHEAVAIALWILHAWVHDHLDISPLLAVTSPEMRCGKTTVLRVVMAMLPRPLPAANITAAAMFRSIEAWHPSLVIDEADTFMGESEELRGVINSGQTRDTAFVVRTVENGGKHEPAKFTTWCPKVIATIGKLKATLVDRSITIVMRRKMPTDKVERLRPAAAMDFRVMRGVFLRWATDHGAKLADADPALPSDLHDRAADNWRPLIAIADRVGGDWKAKARAAAIALSGASEADSDSTKTMLLVDLRDIFAAEQAEVLQSETIVDRLGKMEHRPWPEWKHGKPLTAAGLARLLKPFGIASDQHWTDGRKIRGYAIAHCLDVFSRYIPPQSGRTVEPASNLAFMQESHPVGNEILPDTKTARNTHEYSVSTALPLQTPPEAENGNMDAPDGDSAGTGTGHVMPGYRPLTDDEFPPIPTFLDRSPNR